MIYQYILVSSKINSILFSIYSWMWSPIDMNEELVIKKYSEYMTLTSPIHLVLIA